MTFHRISAWRSIRNRFANCSTAGGTRPFRSATWPTPASPWILVSFGAFSEWRNICTRSHANRTLPIPGAATHKTSGGISLCQKLEKTTKAVTCGQERHNAQTAAICLSISWVRRKSTFMILTLPACGPKKKCSTVTAKTVFAPRRLWKSP